MCGRNEDAMKFYTEALQLYRNILERCIAEQTIFTQSASSKVAHSDLTASDITAYLSSLSSSSQEHQRVSALVAAYANTLNNLGALYRAMAENPVNSQTAAPVSAMDRLHLTDRAEEALRDAWDLRCQILGLKK